MPWPRALRAVALALATAPLAAQTVQQASVQVTASVAASPAITFHWPADPTASGYSVSRRFAGTSAWSPAIQIPGAGAATSWLESTALFAQRYEYLFVKAGTPPGRGFITAGLEAPAFEQRGKLVLVVDATHVAALGSRLARLEADLAGDGWHVLRHDVAPTASVPSVKALIAGSAAAFPGQVKAVFLLGHVPVPYSGAINPDGHADHYGAWPADVFYGELNGTWTDSIVNTTVASRPANHNVPGDGKYDQSTLPSDVDLAVGRVDFANMPAFPASEATLLADYLDKNHDYRHRVIAVDQRAVIDDNFGWFSGEAFAATGWRNFSPLVGTGNVIAADYFTTLNTTTGNGYAWSYGCGGGTYTSAGGVGSTLDFVSATNRNVFTMLFGSYHGDWDSPNNFLRAPLASGWTLASAWAGRPHWLFHQMGMGDTIGTCARQSQNETIAGGFGARSVHIALMGDPTLRQHIVAPASNVIVTDLWPQANVAWSPSPDAVAGYHVYRAATAAGPFTRLTNQLVAGTTWSDPAPLAGTSHYMVRAQKLETTPSGSYWNESQGVFAAATLPTQAASHAAYGAGCHGLALAASPPPVSTATTGTLVVHTVSGIPEAALGSGVYLGLTILSTTQDIAGTSLAPLGMPGCASWIGALDAPTAFIGNTPVQSTSFQVPAGVPPGMRIFAMAVALVQAGTVNPFGAVTSNGVASFVNSF